MKDDLIECAELYHNLISNSSLIDFFMHRAAPTKYNANGGSGKIKLNIPPQLESLFLIRSLNK